MYDLAFDEDLQPNDKLIEDKGIKLVVDKKSVLYLAGTILDFSDGLNGKGFHFVNPNASRTCGCGESFSV
jgi:iron-sulfur cluster assembly protein